MSRYTIVILSGLLAASFWTASPAVAAENPPKLTISPATQHVEVTSDAKVDPLRISLKNQGDLAISLTFQAVNLSDLRSRGIGPALPAATDSGYELASWLQVPKGVITVQANGTYDARINLRNDASLSPGGHYGAIIAKVVSVGGQPLKPGVAGEANAQITLQQEITSLIFLKKTGGERYDLSLSHTDIQSSSFALPDKVGVTLRNDGNVHVIPRGLITFTDPRGRLVAKGIIDEESAILFPGSSRLYPVPLRSLESAIIPGRYLMSIQYRHEGTPDFQTKTQSFIIIPHGFYMLIAILLALSVAGYGIRKRLRMNSKGRR